MELRARKTGRETAAGRVDVHRDIQVRVVRQRVQGLTNRLHRLVLAGERHAQGGHDADRVLVDSAQHFFGRQQ